MHTAVLYIHGFLAPASASGRERERRAERGDGAAWRSLKVKSIMHEGPRAKPKSLKP